MSYLTGVRRLSRALRVAAGSSGSRGQRDAWHAASSEGQVGRRLNCWRPQPGPAQHGTGKWVLAQGLSQVHFCDETTPLDSPRSRTSAAAHHYHASWHLPAGADTHHAGLLDWKVCVYCHLHHRRLDLGLESVTSEAAARHQPDSADTSAMDSSCRAYTAQQSAAVPIHAWHCP